MENQHTQSHKHQLNTPPANDIPVSPGGASLAEQARQFADVARKACASLQKGVAAEQELLNRRNQSGQ